VSRGEAFDRLEHSAGPHARKMFERILEQVKEVEAKYQPSEICRLAIKDLLCKGRAAESRT
jgi:hypothetical protein